MPVLTLNDPNSLSIRAKALVFEDPKSRATLERLRQIAPSDATVLITGETGTGKEIAARHIHRQSQRADRAFVAMNCGALAASLAESELFGHERGAFTGALTTKIGWFEAAHSGTLFLDEIGDLPLAVQVKLLRVLQEGEVVRVGARQPVPVDVRLIAATNVDLEEAVAAGRFREDLYYRLNVATLVLPPLRERSGDILPLARHFVSNYARKLEAGNVQLSPEAEQRLLEYSWPGNIRELENVVHHALLVGQGDFIQPRDLRLTARAERPTPPAPSEPVSALDDLRAALVRLFEDGAADLFGKVEEALVRSAYDYCDRNQVQTARLLGISRNIVRARLSDYGELPSSVRPPRAPNAGELPNVAGLPAADRTAFGSNVVRIGYQRFGLLPLVKAHGALNAAFAERGFRVEWLEYAGGIQLIEDFQKSRLALGAVGEGPPVFAFANQVPIVYLAAEAPAPEGEALIVPKYSPITSVVELRGKTIALNRGANVQYLLIRALEAAGVAYSEVRVVYMPPAEAHEAFIRGSIDAWAIWSPFLDELLSSREARLLTDARGLAENAVYYIGDPGFATQHSDLVDLFVTHIGTLARSLAPSRAPRLVDDALFVNQQRVADAFHRNHLIPRPVRVDAHRWFAHKGVPSESARVREQPPLMSSI